MKLSTVLQRIPYWYEAGQDGGFSVYLTSGPGVGKTSVLCDAVPLLADRFKLRMGRVIINGGNLNEMDTQGYLVPRHHEGYADSIFTKPFWWTTDEGKRLEEYEGGIIIVDEADKLPVECKKIMGEACESNRLGSHYIPKGWRVWMAGNRAGDRSGSTKELDHLINRRMEIPIQPDLESWLDWSAKNGVTPTTRGFANSNAEIVFKGEVPEKQGPWCTPRSLVKADRYLQVLVGPNGDFPTDATTLEEIGGIIGEGATRQYVNTIRLQQEMPKFETIVANPEKVKVPDAPDAQMLVIFNLAHRVTADNCEKVIKYVDRYPKEFAVTFTSSACNRDPKLISTPAFNSWCMRNASLVTVITRKAA